MVRNQIWLYARLEVVILYGVNVGLSTDGSPEKTVLGNRDRYMCRAVMNIDSLLADDAKSWK